MCQQIFFRYHFIWEWVLTLFLLSEVFDWTLLSVAVKCLTINLQIHLDNLSKFKLMLENKLRLDQATNHSEQNMAIGMHYFSPPIQIQLLSLSTDLLVIHFFGGTLPLTLSLSSLCNKVLFCMDILGRLPQVASRRFRW